VITQARMVLARRVASVQQPTGVLLDRLTFRSGGGRPRRAETRAGCKRQEVAGDELGLVLPALLGLFGGQVRGVLGFRAPDCLGIGGTRRWLPHRHRSGRMTDRNYSARVLREGCHHRLSTGWPLSRWCSPNQFQGSACDHASARGCCRRICLPQLAKAARHKIAQSAPREAGRARLPQDAPQRGGGATRRREASRSSGPKLTGLAPSYWRCRDRQGSHGRCSLPAFVAPLSFSRFDKGATKAGVGHPARGSLVGIE